MRYFTTNRKITLILILSIYFLQNLSSQFILDAEIRPRAEYRNGFRTLMPDSANPAFSISQRTRFNAFFNKDKVKVFVSLQDIRTWGDVGQLNVSDRFGLAIHQAWGQFGLGEYFAFKVGRQELIYDDHRIFGNVGWAQQARSHDLLLSKFKKNKFALDFGVAFNQTGQSLVDNPYTITNNYKAMQFLWANYSVSAVKISFLILNNGLQYINTNDSDSNETRYSQTFGTHIKSRLLNLIDLTGNFYYTGGKDRGKNPISAYNAALDVNFKPKDAKWSAGFGFEIMSGNDITDGVADLETNNAFNPFFGTNHKFNGLMDYFYVGNHINSIGLVDVYVKGGIAFGKSKFILAFHNFMSSATITIASEAQSKQLGSELDIVYVLKVNSVVNIKAGYSQMFASESMGLIKTGNYQNTNNWAWLMLTLKPQLFKHEYTSKKEL